MRHKFFTFLLIFLIGLCVFFAAQWYIQLSSKSDLIANVDARNAELNGTLIETQELLATLRSRQLPLGVSDMDCPRFTYTGIEDEPENLSHCAFFVEQGPGFSEWAGLVTIVGTYVEYTRDDWMAVEAGAPEGTQATCSALRITTSYPNFTDEIFESTKRGNTVNRIENDQLLLNIPLDTLTLEEQTQIKTASGPVRITGFMNFAERTVVPACHSKIDEITDVSFE